jgi:hypothetical protein
MRDRVDHPRKGSKDLADAVCGSIYNAISMTRPDFGAVEVHTYDSVRRKYREENKQEPINLIKAPSAMPKKLADMLDGMEIV